MSRYSKMVSQDIGAIRSIKNPRDSFKAFCDIIPNYGFTYAVIGYVINPFMQSLDNDAGLLSNWKPEWLREWVSKHYVFHDPVALYLARANVPFSWDDAYQRYDGPFSRKLRANARGYGLSQGIAIPILRPNGPRGCVSLGTEDDNKPLPEDWTNIVAFSEAVFAHIESIRPPLPFDEDPSLTDREIEVLFLVAAGKTNWESGMMLGISEHSIRDHLKSVSRKLQTTNRAHSVARAIQMGVIIP